MPHCFLEYSSHLKDLPDLSLALREVNSYLADTGLFNLADIKSRAVGRDVYAVGDGQSGKAFVALTIGILGGRDERTRARIAEGALAILTRLFSEASRERSCSVTVEVREIHRESYRKVWLPES